MKEAAKLLQHAEVLSTQFYTLSVSDCLRRCFQRSPLAFHGAEQKLRFPNGPARPAHVAQAMAFRFWTQTPTSRPSGVDRMLWNATKRVQDVSERVGENDIRTSEVY